MKFKSLFTMSDGSIIKADEIYFGQLLLDSKNELQLWIFAGNSWRNLNPRAFIPVD